MEHRKLLAQAEHVAVTAEKPTSSTAANRSVPSACPVKDGATQTDPHIHSGGGIHGDRIDGNQAYQTVHHNVLPAAQEHGSRQQAMAEGGGGGGSTPKEFIPSKEGEAGTRGRRGTRGKLARVSPEEQHVPSVSSLDDAAQKIEWVSIDDLDKPSWLKVIQYYLVGLVNNGKHKVGYLALCARTEVVSEKLFSIQDNLHDMRVELLRDISRPQSELPSERLREIEKLASQKPDGPDRARLLRVYHKVDEIIMHHHEAFWIARVPLNHFWKEYKEGRQTALTLETSCDPVKSIDEQQDMVEALISAVKKLQTMSDFVKLFIDNNDQLLFKAFTFVLHCATIVGQYLWSEHLAKEIGVDIGVS